MANQPVSMCCIYQVKKGQVEAFRALLDRHWPTLDGVGLVSTEPARILRGKNKDGAAFFIETFQWKNDEAPDIAHQSPEVMAVWEPMGALADHMEFIELEREGVEG